LSRLDAGEPVCNGASGPVELLIESRSRDLGGFSVRRVLPASDRQTVGPFIFFDEMGPAQFEPGNGINVRPHPHIGLATVTYLFDGQILHRDSLGCVQAIEPGAVNLMTAGRGIVHSERTSPERQRDGQRLHGVQTWMALPDDQQEIDPAFVHHPAADLPVIETAGVRSTVIIGSFGGRQSPVTLPMATLYLAVELDAQARFDLPGQVEERALYLLDGRVRVDDQTLAPGTMAVLSPAAARVTADVPSRVMLLGGAATGPRTVWWNFVHADPERIERAREDWRLGRFAPVPGDDEFIPLPETS